MAKDFWQSNSYPLAIAHRGGGARHKADRYLKENTLETFQKTEKLGYQFLELDVTSTKDNKVIVVHVSVDPIEKRVKKDAPDAIKMQSYTHKELKSLLSRDVPTLEQVLKSLPKAKFLVDTKTDSVVELMAPILKDTKSSGRLLLNSFFPHRLWRLMELIGQGPEYGLIISRYPRALNKNYRLLMGGYFNDKGLSAIALPYRYSNEKSLAYLHEQDFKVMVWTPNRIEQIEKCVSIGADGIMTDNAELLAGRLLRNKI